MLKVWGRRSSFNVQKVMWLIGELGLAHAHIDAGGSFGGLDAPDFLAMNPHGRIPVIRDGDVTVWESHAILRYLAARHGGGHFWSDDPVARACVDGWMDWSQTALQPDFLGGVFWGFYRTPQDKRNWPAINAALARCARHFEKLNRLLEGRSFLLGEALSLADITAGTSLYRYFELEIDRPQLAEVERWYRTLQARAAFRTHVMIPFEELRGAPARSVAGAAAGEPLSAKAAIQPSARAKTAFTNSGLSPPVRPGMIGQAQKPHGRLICPMFWPK